MLLTPYPHMYIMSLHQAVVMSTDVCCLVQQIVKAHRFDASFQGHTRYDCQLLISSHCMKRTLHISPNADSTPVCPTNRLSTLVCGCRQCQQLDAL